MASPVQIRVVRRPAQFVDSAESLGKFVQDLCHRINNRSLSSQGTVLYIDLEGINLCRNSRVSLLTSLIRERLSKNSLIYAAHILDPRCKASLIKLMMPDQYDDVINAATKFFHAEWPELAHEDLPSASDIPSNEPELRPFGMSLAQFKALQNKKVKDEEERVALPSCELLRWLASPPLEWNEVTNNDPDFVRQCWKEHAYEWPL